VRPSPLADPAGTSPPPCSHAPTTADAPRPFFTCSTSETLFSEVHMSHPDSRDAADASLKPDAGRQLAAECDGRRRCAFAPPRKMLKLEHGQCAVDETLSRYDHRPAEFAQLSLPAVPRQSMPLNSGSAVRLAALTIPPPKSHYVDHLTRRARSWPRGADGRARTCAQITADVLIQCGLIAAARAFCLRRLNPPLPLPLHLARGAYAACQPPNSTANERLCVRCSEVTFIATKMARAVNCTRRARDCSQLVAAVVDRVFKGYSKATQVRRCAVYAALQLRPRAVADERLTGIRRVIGGNRAGGAGDARARLCIVPFTVLLFFVWHALYHVHILSLLCIIATLLCSNVSSVRSVWVMQRETGRWSCCLTWCWLIPRA
jgi:hypothetical protein